MDAAWPLFLNGSARTLITMDVAIEREKEETAGLGRVEEVSHLFTKASKVSGMNFRDAEEF